MDVQDWMAIWDLKARYCRLLDTKQWDAWRDLFTEDYELDTSQESGTPPLKGRDNAIDKGVLPFIRDAVTVHQVHTPEIEVQGDEAQVVWAMQDCLLFPDGAALTGYGHYHERLRRVDGGWKIAALRLTRLHLDYQPAPAAG